MDVDLETPLSDDYYHHDVLETIPRMELKLQKPKRNKQAWCFKLSIVSQKVLHGIAIVLVILIGMIIGFVQRDKSPIVSIHVKNDWETFPYPKFHVGVLNGNKKVVLEKKITFSSHVETIDIVEGVDLPEYNISNVHEVSFNRIPDSFETAQMMFSVEQWYKVTEEGMKNLDELPFTELERQHMFSWGEVIIWTNFSSTTIGEDVNTVAKITSNNFMGPNHGRIVYHITLTEIYKDYTKADPKKSTMVNFVSNRYASPFSQIPIRIDKEKCELGFFVSVIITYTNPAIRTTILKKRNLIETFALAGGLKSLVTMVFSLLLALSGATCYWCKKHEYQYQLHKVVYTGRKASLKR